MLVHLADWCYRQRRLVVVLWIAALAAALALASSFGGETKQDYLQPGSESQAASETLQAPFPQRRGRHRPGRAPRRVAGSPRPRCGTRPRSSSPRWRAPTTSWASPAHSPRAVPPRSRTTARRRTPTSPSTRRPTSTRRRRPRPWWIPSSPLATTPSRSRSAARSPRCHGGPGSAAKAIGLHCGRHHLAVHVRVRGGDGVATAHRSVRPRHRDRARRGAAPRGRRPGLGDRHGGDGRHRRRHRLRAAHRHPVPQQPRRRPRPTATRPPTAIATAGRAVVFAGITVIVSMLGILLMGQPAMNGFAFTVVLAS